MTTSNVFSFESKDVRVQTREDSTWFVLRDVLEAMSSSTRPADAKSVIMDKLGKGHLSTLGVIDALGRKQIATTVSEEGAMLLKNRSNVGNRCNQALYLIHNPVSGLTKIGISSNIKKRMASLQSSCGMKLDLIATYDTDDALTLEQDLHKRWVDKRTYGEWFKIDPYEVVDMIKGEYL